MQVDFYQLGRTPLEQVTFSIAQKLLSEGKRLLIVAGDDGLLSRLDRMLWDHGATSFLPHGPSGGSDDARQPVLLSTSTDAPNLARNILIADGEWREAALTFDRAFHLFDGATLDAARLAWKLLAGREGVERRYWAQDDEGRWVQKS
jgi:DNA polymerase-3 subunit chi